MENCPQNFKPVLYRRYVDDTFLLFRKSDHIQLFLNYLNRQHLNIIFTNKSEINNALPFLDVKITKENNKFTTSVFRKPTLTGLSCNFSSFTLLYKINLIKTLLFRCFNICSNYVLINTKFNFIKDFLLKNGYKCNIIERYIKVFLNNRMHDKGLLKHPKKLKFYSKLSFYGNNFFRIR